MNAPYNGKFKVTQPYSASHTGLDLVGIDEKFVRCTESGTVIHAGWENPDNHSQGFGLFVAIKGDNNLIYYFGHLSEINPTLKQGVRVVISEAIGVEGSTGKSTGSHCHYEVRREFKYADASNTINVSLVSGIPNALGEYDDGYRTNVAISQKIPIKLIIGNDTYEGEVNKK